MMSLDLWMALTRLGFLHTCSQIHSYIFRQNIWRSYRIHWNKNCWRVIRSVVLSLLCFYQYRFVFSIYKCCNPITDGKRKTCIFNTIWQTGTMDTRAWFYLHMVVVVVDCMLELPLFKTIFLNLAQQGFI